MKNLRIRSYFKLLFCPWKLMTFVIAYTALLVFGFFAGDPTWDFGSVSIMSILTFLTAPWAVSILARAIIFRNVDFSVLLAIIVWLVSASLSYDVYVYLKFGTTAESTIENLCISSVFYFLAGLFWSLKDGEASFFEFTETKWPSVQPNISVRILAILGFPLAGLYAIILFMLVK